HWLKLDSSKAFNQLDWRPKFTVEEGLNKTVNWYNHFYSTPDSIKEYSAKQLNDYQKLLES
ncbi:hypothetical protein BVY03_06030, partial [bacterium K02(2017)]